MSQTMEYYATYKNNEANFCFGKISKYRGSKRETAQV